MKKMMEVRRRSYCKHNCVNCFSLLVKLVK
nr:MAG TPA: 4Fe-4S single cluster domain protein [Caudoviricetes sp.]